MAKRKKSDEWEASSCYQGLIKHSLPTARRRLKQALQKAWAPPPRLTVSEWADQFRFLSPEAAAEPGRWTTSRAEYQRGILNACTEPGIHSIFVMTSSQVGKTEVLLNLIGYYIENDPSPILVVLPTGAMAESFSKDRLDPMIRDTPALRQRVAEEKARDKSNTIYHKRFPGGHITMVGANAPANLAARPIRILCADEVDRYPPSAGREGDPFSLALARTKTFWNRKIVATSTPTIKGTSRIEQLFESGDQRHFHVPCHLCGHYQTLRWKGVVWEASGPDTARYKCEECSELWTDGDRWRNIKSGEWRASQETNGIASFHLNEIYSTWVPLNKLVADFLEKKKFPETLRTFINTSLGESWEANEEEFIDPLSIAARREAYGAEVPQEVNLITAGVDIQADRIEMEVVGWGQDEESWGITYEVIPGDTSQPHVWQQLDQHLLRDFKRADGKKMTITAACIDTGFRATMGYEFCRHRLNRRIWPIKGDSSYKRKPLWPKMPTRNAKTPLLYMLGTADGKDLLAARLQISVPGPGFCHFPKTYDATYFSQLLAERPVIKMVKGVKHRVWELISERRNEALDCRIYAMAALQGLVSEGLKLTKTSTAPQTRITLPAQKRVNPFTGKSGGFLN